MLLDDAVGDGETEPGAGSHLLGGEERIEDALLQPLVDARAGVADEQIDHAFPDRGLDVDELPRRVRQGVARVGQEVDDHLLELDRVADDHRIFRAEIQLHLDLAQAELLVEQREGAPNHAVDPHRLAADRRRPPKGAEVRDDRGGPAHLLQRMA